MEISDFKKFDILLTRYSYLPNKRGDPNKRGGWQIHAIGEGGKNFLLHKNSCRGWKFSQN